MAFVDYYKILGVDKNIPQKDVRAAYRKRAKQFHPDLHPNDPKAKAKFQALNEAYEVISDPDKRAKYDQFGENWKNAGGFGGGGFGGGAGGAGGAGGNPFEGFDFSSFGNGGGGFSSFFENLFGGRGRSAGGAGGFGGFGGNVRDDFGAGGCNGGCGGNATASLFISLRILPLFAILIIFGALIRIGDDIIGFIQSLEFCLRLRIVRMQVGMELLCAFTISSSDILLRDILIHTENLIIIYKCHNYNSSIFNVFRNFIFIFVS